MFYVLIKQMIANEQNFPVVLFISDGSNITLCVSLPYRIVCNLCTPRYIDIVDISVDISTDISADVSSDIG